MSTLYDSDFLRWTEQQTDLLRRRASGELPNDEGLDWLNLAEEIEGVGASEKREVRSRLMRICQYLVKWKYQPERRSRSWEATIYVQRRDLQSVFEDSPSLRSFAEQVLPSAFVNGRGAAEREAGLLNLPNDVCPGRRTKYCQSTFCRTEATGSPARQSGCEPYPTAQTR